MYRFVITLFLSAFVGSVLNGQIENPESDRAKKIDFGISVKATSISALGISADYFLSPYLNAELHGTIALTSGVGGGFSYHFRGIDKVKRWSAFKEETLLVPMVTLRAGIRF